MAMAGDGKVIDPKKWRAASRAVDAMSDAYLAAAQSSGKLEASQIRANSQVERYTELLQRQKLSLRDVLRNQKLMQQVYRDQLRMQRMTVTDMGTDKFGRQIANVTVPKDIGKELDSISNKMRFIARQTQSAAQQMINWGKNTQWAGRQLTVGFTVPMAIFGAAAGKAAYDVDKQMTRIQKVYDSQLRMDALSVDKAKEMSRLRAASFDLVREAAMKYGAAATDVLTVEAELAATGLNGASLMESTNQVVRIATLGELDYQKAVEMTIALQTAFKQSSKELTETFDFMNAVENQTSLSIQDIAEATPRAASALSNLGVSAEEMTVLMVSMKESGVDAAEGANALKSATTRILKPVAAAKKFYSQYGIVLDNVSKKSGGNLFKFLKMLGEEQTKINGDTEEETKRLRAVGVATLFGTYQNNRLTASLTNLSDAYNGLSNQTARAMKLMDMSPAERASIAAAELEKKMNSLSGKFDKAWNTFKLALAEAGEMFLPVGTQILNIMGGLLSKITNFFEVMPDGAKKVALLAAGFMAIAGPTIMLAGLMGNLTGWVLKGVAALPLLGNKFNIVNKQQKAATLLAEQTSRAYLTEAEAVAALTMELNALASAQGYSMAVGTQAYHTGIRGKGRGGADIDEKDVPLPKGYTRTTTAKGEHRYYDTTSGKKKRVAADAIPAVAEQRAFKKAVEESEKKIRGAVDATEDLNTETKKTKRSWDSTKASAAGFGLLMGATLIPGAEKFSSALMTAATTFMAVGAAKDLLDMRKAKKGIDAADAASVGLMARWKGIATFAKSWGMRILKFAKVGGPIALAVGASTLLYKKMQESSNRQKSINKSTEGWAKALGVVAEKYERIKIAQGDKNTKGTSASEIAASLKKDKSMKDLIDTVSDSKGSQLDTLMLSEYVKLLDKTGATAQDTKVGIQALFIAAGYGAADAEQKTREYVKLIGDEITNADYKTLWSRQFTDLFSTGGDFDEKMDGMVDNFADTLQKLPNAFARAEFVNEFKDSFSDMWGETLSEALTSGQKAAFAKAGATSPEQIRQLMMDWNNVMRKEMSNADFEKKYDLDRQGANMLGMDIMQMQNNPAIAKLLGMEKQITEAVGKNAGLKEKISSFDQLALVLAGKQYSYTRAQAQAEYTKLTSKKNLTDEQKLEVLNELRVQAGLEETTNLADMFLETTKGTVAWAKKHANAERTVNQILEERAKDIRKDAYTSVTGAVADRAMDALDAQQDAEADALDSSIDAQKNALDAKGDNWNNYFDKLEDKTNNFYDKRVDKINETIKALEKEGDIRRQLYEAEVARMNRLADNKNANIDLNAALKQGNLDEAAKLMNDAVATSMQYQMEDEMSKSDAATEARTEALQKRIDILEQQRDAKLQNIDAQRKAKEKFLEIEKEKFDKQAELQKKNLQQNHDNQKKSYEQAMEMLKAFVPRNKKELLAHMVEVDKMYGIFGGNLKKNSREWANFIGKKTNEELALAAIRMKSDVNWEGSGWDAAQGMLKGMAAGMGMSMEKFEKWMGIKLGQETARPKDAQTTTGSGGGKPKLIMHGGGEVGRARSDRTGFAGGMSPHNEVNLTAQRGEFMMNKKAHQKYGSDFMNSVNDGKFGVGGFSPGEAGVGMFSAVMANAMMNVARTGITKAVNKRVSKKGMPGSSLNNLLTGALAGNTAGFDAEQMKNAGIISNVGRGMGMSERDIVIGLMTAMQESVLRNVNYGDRDSLGLFQQRPSQGWGTKEQVTNPEYASRAFFNALKGIGGRDKMSLTAAAQAVQRSAFPDAYAKWEDEARAVYAALMGGGTSGGFMQGSGGRHRPVPGGYGLTAGLHYDHAVDIGAPTGTPVYAAADGKVIKSFDDVGYEPRQPDGGNGYKSYGRQILIDHGGYRSLYAHLSARNAGTGQDVKGGALIGRVGDTGNSSGPHLHFGTPNLNPMDFIGLRKGGTIKWDDTLFRGHKGETVLPASLTAKFKENVAGGLGEQYNVNIDLRGAYIKEDVDIDRALDAWWNKKEAKPGRKRIVK